MDITANLKYNHRVEVIITVVAWLIGYGEIVILNHYVFYLCVTLCLVSHQLYMLYNNKRYRAVLAISF